MYYKILILVLFLSFVYSDDIKCNQKTIDQLDEYVSKLSVFGDPKRKFPNKEEVQKHCQEDIRMTTWGKDYTRKCMKGEAVETSRHVTDLLMYSIRKVSNKRCRSEATRNTFIHAGKCGNLFKSDTEKCYKQYIMDSEKINKAKKTSITNDKHLLPLLCCSYHKFHDCCTDVWAQKDYAKPCDRKATIELESYVNDSMNDILQYLCGDYQDNNDKCDNLIARYRDILSSVRIKSNAKSPLSASNEVFNSLPPVRSL